MWRCFAVGLIVVRQKWGANVQLKVGAQFGEVRGRVVLERDSVCSGLKMIWMIAGLLGKSFIFQFRSITSPSEG